MKCYAVTKSWARCRNHAEAGRFFCNVHKGWLWGTLITSTGFLVTLGAGFSQILGVSLTSILNLDLSIPIKETNTPFIAATSTPTITSTINVPPVTITKTHIATETLAAIDNANLICTDNILTHIWHLEAESNAAEDWDDFSDKYILQNKDIIRITYDLNGLIAQEGTGKNDSTIVFTQPHWFGVSFVHYGVNGFDGEQTIDIPLSEFLELPNPAQNITGGKPLDLNKPVSSIRARFWHQDHFSVEISAVYFCTFP